MTASEATDAAVAAVAAPTDATVAALSIIDAAPVRVDFVPAGQGFHCYTVTVLLPPSLRVVASFTGCLRTEKECRDSLGRLGGRTHRTDAGCRRVEHPAFCHQERVQFWSEYMCFARRATCAAMLAEDKEDESDPRTCVRVD